MARLLQDGGFHERPHGLRRAVGPGTAAAMVGRVRAVPVDARDTDRYSDK